ncbi:hypothetical protein BpHYR1_012583 [Brachionus plicatilis]|uniref:Uncharacterized protein n=1 Tax=Brachionus plicatilis TaxID=10195 RepID=A0A3M7T240_BRAPC|nr:hypothetical protein BpHYR1_012583 [Brachionus plicatilis]
MDDVYFSTDYFPHSKTALFPKDSTFFSSILSAKFNLTFPIISKDLFLLQEHNKTQVSSCSMLISLDNWFEKFELKNLAILEHSPFFFATKGQQNLCPQIFVYKFSQFLSRSKLHFLSEFLSPEH